MDRSRAGLFEALRAEIFDVVCYGAIPRVARELESVRPDESLFDASNRMWWRQVGVLPVDWPTFGRQFAGREAPPLVSELLPAPAPSRPGRALPG